jgi:DNA processing protein
MVDHSEKIMPWFALKGVAGIGNLLFKRLIERFQTPERVFAAPSEQLMQVEACPRA